MNTGDPSVIGSTINDNDGPGFTHIFGTLTMDSTVLAGNDGNGVNDIDSAPEITNSAAGDNNGWGSRGTGNAASGQSVNLPTVNSIDDDSGGRSCAYCTDLNVLNSTIFSNDGVVFPASCLITLAYVYCVLERTS